jgi:DNA segregation ATPase FtsK/SpoIIIE, S-DNA-T family
MNVIRVKHVGGFKDEDVVLLAVDVWSSIRLRISMWVLSASCQWAKRACQRDVGQRRPAIHLLTATMTSSVLGIRRVEPWAFWEPTLGHHGAEALERLATELPAFFANSTLVDSRFSWLPFYREHRLMELTFVRDGDTERAFVLDGPSGTAWLNGESEPIHDTNAAESLQLSAEAVPDYVRFFFYFLRADEGAFVLIESGEEIGPGADAGQPGDEGMTLTAARAEAYPLKTPGPDATEPWLLDATVVYGAGLFTAKIGVQANGEVEMVDDQQVGVFGDLAAPWVPRLELEARSGDSSGAVQIASSGAVQIAAPSGPSEAAREGTDATGAEPASGVTALQAAAENMAGLKQGWQQVIDHAWNAGSQILQGFVDAHPDLTNVLVELNQVREELAQTYQAQLGQSAPMEVGREVRDADPAVWLSQARAAIDRLRTESIPWRATRRAEWAADWHQSVGHLMFLYDVTCRGVALDAWHRMRMAGAKKAQAIKESAGDSVPDYFVPLPPIGPRDEPIDPREPIVVGPGPLNFFLGYVYPEWLSFSTTSYWGYETAAEQLEPLGPQIPAVIDLDVIGALLVDDPRCFEMSVLNLLSALPANQLLIKIFDPEHGGASAKFLFGLGDAGQRIIGDRVRTTERDLDDLLQSTEEHITLVTQRFLQGEHQSLTEYNRAAGEVAEAYHLIVLYDFPSGFVRAGRPDDEQLKRLNKIIRNGPPTGVFTIVVHNGAAAAAPGPVDEQQSSASLQNILHLLPWFCSGPAEPETLKFLGGGSHGLKFWTEIDAPNVSGAVATVSGAELSWALALADPPSDAVAASLIDVVKRNIHAASDVQVTAQRVAELADAAQRAESAALGEQFGPTVAFPDRADTWWRASSARAVVAHFGRIGSRQVANLTLDSEDGYSALIGGQPGSGKSVLIHSVIMSIAIEYAPSEVELYLIDFKEGVEFKVYADIGLPHARVIAIESERDFGLSVLRRVAGEMKLRGELFRNAPGDPANVEQYRGRTGERLKRLVLIIDEFQQLFYRDDKIGGESAEILELILRQGRAFGVHLVLASQSLAGMANLGRHVLGFIPIRIALQSNESDSRMTLGEDNPDADSLVRAGEGILNLRRGHKDANQRFQAAFWNHDQRSAVLGNVVERARNEGLEPITTVFEGHKPADVADIDERSLVPVADSGLAIPVGLPLALEPDPLFARLRRESGSNLLIVDEHGHGAVVIAVSSLRQQGAVIDLLDFVGDDENWNLLRDHLESLPGVGVYNRRTMPGALAALTAEITQRQSLNDSKGQPRVLVIAGMDRARDFDPNDFTDQAPTPILGQILRDGPEVGVFVVAWFDRPAAVAKRLDRQQRKEFGQCLLTQANRDDSAELIDSDSATSLKPGQGVLADLDRGTEHKIRTFATPTASWLTDFNNTTTR